MNIKENILRIFSANFLEVISLRRELIGRH